MEAYRRAMEMRPDSLLPVQSLARALYDGGEVEAAREMYERALELATERDEQEEILLALADMAFEAVFSSPAGAVPEPRAVSLLGLGGLLWLGLSRRRRCHRAFLK